MGSIELIGENTLLPQDMEEVRIFLDPVAELAVWQTREIKSHIDAQFSIAYVFAVAAHRVKIGADWQSLKTTNNSEIKEFMRKVKVSPYPQHGQKKTCEPQSRTLRSRSVS